MDLKLTFPERVANRWRVRLEIPPDLHHHGVTVGLWDEDGRPLSPAVVLPADAGCVFDADLGGPEQLPPGARVRAVADLDDGGVLESSIAVHKHAGLHAYLRGELKMTMEPAPKGAALTTKEIQGLARVFPWMRPPSEEVPVRPTSMGDDLLDMLREDFDVDVEGMDDELLRTLKT